jgi:hypothetical protein
MSSGNVRRGVSQANFNEQFIGLVYFEIFAIAALVGWYQTSWYYFGGALIGLVILLMIPFVNLLLAVAFAVGWGFLGYSIGKLISQDASYVIGGILFLSGLGVHMAAIEWTKDVASTNDRNV